VIDRWSGAGATDADEGAVTPALESADGFAAWVEPHVPRMALLAARLAPGADRDDIVQEALLKAWHARRKFDPARGVAGSWLLTITANAARDAAKSKGHSNPRLTVVPEFGVHPVPGWAPRIDSEIDIERAIAALPKRQRLAVNCFYLVGLSITETAAVMRCAPGTVKSALSHARDNLRSALEESS
jgi:RNA polymerase sigma factor (sigma-70 family)